MKTGCSSEVSEPYALQAIDDSMMPEFENGAIIIVDPGGIYRDGSFVVADHFNEPIFRQLVISDEGTFLKPLNEAFPTIEVQQPLKIHGVVIQKSYKRKRTHYK